MYTCQLRSPFSLLGCGRQSVWSYYTLSLTFVVFMLTWNVFLGTKIVNKSVIKPSQHIHHWPKGKTSEENTSMHSSHSMTISSIGASAHTGLYAVVVTVENVKDATAACTLHRYHTYLLVAQEALNGIFSHWISALIVSVYILLQNCICTSGFYRPWHLHLNMTHLFKASRKHTEKCQGNL